MSHAILLISCPDQRGITAAVAQFIADHNGNIIDAQQHSDMRTNAFFMRIEWSLDGFDLGREEIQPAFQIIRRKFNMEASLSFDDEVKRLAIFVSKPLHCLYDLLYRYRSGQLSCEIPLIVSNHEDARKLADDFGIRFSHWAVFRENKADVERQQLEVLKEYRIDSIVLARYHQILTPHLINEYRGRIINIHHSFLPAFVGANPYQQAYEKGVKIIGVTSHFVTEELDQGPIIEQDTVRITHRDSVEDLKRKGEDLERVVLSRAVRWHLQQKILCTQHRTVVFD